ncbi:MAG TPA: COX15/CtaA family protein [Gemmatimonadales bacterium]|nr:COX15/CtaA family protein [Gemmatimonadales bacterium]
MTRRFMTLAWSAAVCTYLLIVLGAVVRITGSGMGCGDHWPLCNGRLFPPLDDIGTLIEWSHRLMAALVSILVAALAIYDWWLHRPLRFAQGRLSARLAVRPSAIALGLLIVQVLLGAITVWLELPAWSVVLHLGTAMLLLATLLIAARGTTPGFRPGLAAAVAGLAFVTILFGALTANLGAAAACGGFPLCNGQIWTTAGPLALIHWSHRLLAYALVVMAAVWAIRTPGTGPRLVLALVALQIVVGAATVLLALPGGLQAAHVAVGTAVWAAVVIAAVSGSKQKAPAAPGPMLEDRPEATA